MTPAANAFWLAVGASASELAVMVAGVAAANGVLTDCRPKSRKSKVPVRQGREGNCKLDGNTEDAILVGFAFDFTTGVLEVVIVADALVFVGQIFVDGNQMEAFDFFINVGWFSSICVVGNTCLDVINCLLNAFIWDVRFFFWLWH